MLPWKVGVASARITPADWPLPMAGYAARKEPAEGTEPDLFATAIAIEAAIEVDHRGRPAPASASAAGTRAPEMGVRTVSLSYTTPERPDLAYPVQAVRSGDDLFIIALASEATIDYAWRLKIELAKRNARAVWVAGYSNEHAGYIPSRRVLLERGYEAQSRPWDPSLAERIVGKEHELVGRLQSPMPRPCGPAGTTAVPPAGPRRYPSRVPRGSRFPPMRCHAPLRYNRLVRCHVPEDWRPRGSARVEPVVPAGSPSRRARPGAWGGEGPAASRRRGFRPAPPRSPTEFQFPSPGESMRPFLFLQHRVTRFVSEMRSRLLTGSRPAKGEVRVRPNRVRWLASCTVGLLLVSGCAENPGNWPPEKVKTATIQHFALVDIDLQPDGSGGYHAKGKTADGETLDIKVTMNPATHRIEWSATGDRGFIEQHGFYELK